MDAKLYLRLLKTVVGIVGISGNSLVCVVIAKVPAMRTLTNALIFNQAVIDFLASVFLVLQSNIETPSPLDQNPIIAILQCYIWKGTVIQWDLFVASTFNLVVLTSERYTAIVYPFKYLTYFARKQATILIVGVWVLAIAYKSSNALYRQIVNDECEIANLSAATYTALGVITFLLEYLIPLILMTFCYIHIILRLKKEASTIHPGPSAGQDENSMSGSLLRARRNTLKTLFIVFVTYVICWSPNQIAFFMFNFGLKLNFEGAFYYVSIALVQLNCCANPIIYSFKYKQFQKGLRVVLQQCFPKLVARRDGEMVSIIASRARITTAEAPHARQAASP